MTYQEFDLFGDPVRQANGRRGRPKHVPTQENRNKIIMLLAMGWSNERIGNALHCSQPTLRRYYFSELKSRNVQRDRLVSHQLMIAMEQANKGNVGAMRLLDQLIVKNDLALVTDSLKRAQSKPRTKVETPGKKAQAALEAHKTLDGENGGDWDDDLNPNGGMH